MIKKLLMGTVALAALSTTALAADLPSRRAPPVYVPPIPVFSWTGFYIGGQIGDAFGRDTYRYQAPAALSRVGGVGHPTGIIGGAHMGYNLSTQGLGLGPVGIFGGGLVIGIEGDFDGTDYRDTTIANLGTSRSIRNDIQGSVRGRIGVAVDRALFYATGGAAFAQFQENFTGINLGGFGIPSQTASHTRVGYTVGGGVEYAVTTQWSLRAEFRYSDFGTIQDTLVNDAATRLARRETQERAQVGFSYKFDTPVAPVVARY